MKNKKFNAFTLAEVLITLGIIGIVSAMTIPTLIHDTKNMQYKAAWKESYAQISQATQMIMKDNGYSLKGICGTLDANCITTLYKNYIKIVNICSNNSSYQCFPKVFYLDGSTFLDLSYLKDTTNNSMFSLANGTSVFIRYHDSTCSYTNGNPCGWMLMDTNGLRGPNLIGRDVFGISIYPQKLVPYGSGGTLPNSVSGGSPQKVADNECETTGMSCAALFLQE